jgi:hypothetical protein
LPNANEEDFLQPQPGGNDDAFFNHTERNADGSDGKVRNSHRARPVQSADPCSVLRPFWFNNRRHTRCAQGAWQKAQALPELARRRQTSGPTVVVPVPKGMIEGRSMSGKRHPHHSLFPRLIKSDTFTESSHSWQGQPRRGLEDATVSTPVYIQCLQQKLCSR